MMVRRGRKELQVQAEQALLCGGVLCSTSERRGRRAAQQMDSLRPRRGFTLLEVLVALSIVAIAVTVVLQLFSADLRALSASEDYVSAVLKAEARMREVLDTEGLAERSWSEATRDGYRIDVSVSEVTKEKTDNLPVKLVKVDLTTRWYRGKKEKSLTLGTMKVVDKLTLATDASSPAPSKPGTGSATSGSTASGSATTPRAGRQ